MAKVGSLEVDLIANIAQFTEQMKAAVAVSKESAQNISEAFTHVGEFLALAEGIKLATEGFEKLVDVTEEAESAQAKVRQVLISTGSSAGVTADDVNELADKMRILTGINQEAIVNVEAVLLRFNKMTKEALPGAVEATLNLAKAMGGDLDGAARQVGLILDNPTKAMTRMQREGIAVTQSQIDMVKAMQKSGDQAGATAEAFEVLNRSTGGVAAAARDTLGGALGALNSDFEELTKSVGLPGGFRDTIELADQAIEDLTKKVKEMNDPTTKAGQEYKKFTSDTSKGFDDLVNSTENWTNITIYDLQKIYQWQDSVNKGWSELGEGMKEGMEATIPGLKQLNDGIGGFGKGALDALGKFTNFNQEAENEVKRGLVPNYLADWFKPFNQALDDTEKRAKEKVASIHQTAASAKGIAPAQDGDAGDPKAEKALEKQEATLARILDNFKEGTKELQLQADGHKDLEAEMKAEDEISKLGLVSLKDKSTVLKEIQKLQADRAAAEKEIADQKENKSLDEILQSYKDLVSKAEQKNNADQTSVELAEAEAKIKKALVDTDAQALKTAQEIRDEATKLAAVNAANAAKAKDTESQKKAQEEVNDMKKKTQELQNQVDGQTQMNSLLADEQKIKDDPYMTSDEKQKYVDALTDEYNKQLQLNDALKDQAEQVSNIVNNHDSDKKKMDELTYAEQQGTITGQQWADAMNKVHDSAQKAGDTGQQLAGILGGGLEKAIQGGESLSKVLEDVGKQILQLAAKKLLLDPLEKGLGSLFDKITGTGQGQGGPKNLPQGGSYSPYQGYGYNQPGGGLAGGASNTPGYGVPGGAPVETDPNAYDLGPNFPDVTGGQMPQSQQAASSGGVLSALGTGVTDILKLFGWKGFAAGGDFNAGDTFVAGEEGPELITARSNGTVLNAGQTSSVFQGSQLNGFGQYTPGLVASQTLPQYLEQEVNRIMLAGNGKKIASLAQALPPDSPYKAELDQESQWGYNPQRSDGQAYNADGAAEWVLNPGGEYNQVAQAAQLAGVTMPSDLVTALKSIDASYAAATGNGSFNYGSSGGGDGGTNFGDGTGGGDAGGGGYSVGGQGGNMDAPGQGFGELFGEGPGGSAFPDYRGGTGGGGVWQAPPADPTSSPSDPFGGGGTGDPDYDAAVQKLNKMLADLKNPAQAQDHSSGWMPDGDWGDDNSPTASSGPYTGPLNTEPLNQEPGGGAPPTVINGTNYYPNPTGGPSVDPSSLTPEQLGMGNPLQGSASQDDQSSNAASPTHLYAAAGGVWDGSGQQLAEFNVKGDHTSDVPALGQGIGKYSVNPVYGVPVGEPVSSPSLSTSLNNDIFSQDNMGTGDKSAQDPRYAKFSQQSQIDNSGITDGIIQSLLGAPKKGQGGPVKAGEIYNTSELGVGEFFKPNSDGHIIPADKAAGLGQETHVHVNVSHPGVSPSDVAITKHGNDTYVDIRKLVQSEIVNNGGAGKAIQQTFGLNRQASKRS